MKPESRNHSFTFTVERSDARDAYVTERLQAFNRAHLPTGTDSVPLETYVIDGAERVVGGLVGRTVWGWLEISVLWVEEQLRRRGLGSELMRRAEAEARQRGCVAARFSTWDFQALGFYERRGYAPYGRLEGYPAGHTVHYLRKDLNDQPTIKP